MGCPSSTFDPQTWQCRFTWLNLHTGAVSAWLIVGFGIAVVIWWKWSEIETKPGANWFLGSIGVIPHKTSEVASASPPLPDADQRSSDPRSLGSGLDQADKPTLIPLLPERVDPEKWKNRVLWVDDNPVNNILLCDDFKKLNVAVTLARTTEQALTLLSQDRFGAIISDVRREDEPRAGYDLLNTLRDRGDHTPYFSYAGRAGRPEHQAEATASGAQVSTGEPQKLFLMVMPILQAYQ